MAQLAIRYLRILCGGLVGVFGIYFGARLVFLGATGGFSLLPTEPSLKNFIFSVLPGLLFFFFSLVACAKLSEFGQSKRRITGYGLDFKRYLSPNIVMPAMFIVGILIALITIASKLI